ncbi:hypothetical protein R6242_02465 [Iodobacter sp. CM08]|uniref:hypothetical protein n=1 Tax=Iodobacter sp. CM08 TaxID=3085902 RepID=UPI002981784B|nr:hypothetical protein [Iodobacter sp. CM08]MDW5415431.1 hypothetical protein [Iodobacter sp. CM08]
METSIITQIITASSVLFGVALTSFAQSRTQRRNQQFQYSLETERHAREEIKSERALALDRLATAHRQLSAIGREFSITNLDIIWRAKMEDLEYDQRYLNVCQEVDELRVIAGLYETSIGKDVEHIYGQMNIFWGSFKNVLRLTALGENVASNISGLDKAHAAALEIENKTASIKHQLTELAKQY